MKKPLRYACIMLLLVIIGVMLLPSRPIIPVQGATSHDWHHQSFWYEPWGSSGVHKGIDIFGKRHTIVLAPITGLVIFSGKLAKGGHAIAILGAKWRVHYLSHLQTRTALMGDWVNAGQPVATLGSSGNAQGKAPHVHYSISSLIPLPWRLSSQTQGWKKMFYLNPHDHLSKS